jgi:hypothetical protein
MTKCLIIICAVACDLNKACKCEYDWSIGLHVWPNAWTDLRIHPVWESIFTEQSIRIVYT